MDHERAPEPDSASTSEESAFEAAAFVENPEPRCPCVLVIDSSSAMEGAGMQELNQALALFREELLVDELAAKRVEVAVVTYPESRCVTPFSGADAFTPPVLEAHTSEGRVSLTDALELATELVTERKETYKLNGVQYYRPLMFLITTGREPDWEIAADLVRAGESEGAFCFQAVGVQGANMELLSLLATRDPIALEGLRFGDLFQWLGRSMQAVSNSHVESEFALPAWPLAA